MKSITTLKNDGFKLYPSPKLLSSERCKSKLNFVQGTNKTNFTLSRVRIKPTGSSVLEGRLSLKQAAIRGLALAGVLV